MAEPGGDIPAGRWVCVHGHFYQPPRENPWLEEIEFEESALPYHDWNERVAAECYAPNARARILDEHERIRSIVNNYVGMSFDFGPTLLSWMALHDPETYELILEADRSSRQRFSNHGSALAQAYNHAILPLCNERDRWTQVRWGLRDFEFRFGRRAEGMWLPETAVDLQTLDTLARCGVAFTILAPSQAAAWRKIGERRWRTRDDGPFDTTRPYRICLPSGGQIAVFFYDAPVSHAVAFERLLSSGERFARRLIDTFGEGPDGRPRLVHIATDGETYGHHHRFGDMALAYALHLIERDRSARITNYGEFLERHPPDHEARIVERTAWSCAHGLGRWSEDCGCALDGRTSWHQRWRAPLRQALDRLRDSIAPRFEESGSRWLGDPWAARDAYIDVVLDRSAETRAGFYAEHARGSLSAEERSKVLELLEMQRHAMLMYTSCGWFFDEVSGIESVQVMQYAARAAELADRLFGGGFEDGLRRTLEAAPSNLADYGNARRVYEMRVEPARVDLPRYAANHAAGSLFGEESERSESPAFRVEEIDRRAPEAGSVRLLLGRLRVASRITEAEADLVYGFLHLGDHNLNGGVRPWDGEQGYRTLIHTVSGALADGDVPAVLQALEKGLGGLPVSLRTLCRDRQRRILRQILDVTVTEVEALYERVYRRHAPLMRFLGGLETPAPLALRATAELVLTRRVREAFEEPSPEPARLAQLLDEARLASIELDAAGLALAVQGALERLLERLAAAPRDRETIERLAGLAELVRRLPFSVNLARAQDLFYRLTREVYRDIGDRPAERTQALRRLGESLHVVIDDA